MKLFRIALIAIFLTYFIGCTIIFVSKRTMSDYGDDTWFIVSGIDQLSLVKQVAYTMYFAMTIFSKVGYGDMVPINMLE